MLSGHAHHHGRLMTTAGAEPFVQVRRRDEAAQGVCETDIDSAWRSRDRTGPAYRKLIAERADQWAFAAEQMGSGDFRL